MKNLLHILPFLVLPLGFVYSQERLVMSSGQIVMNGGTAFANPIYLVIGNSNANAIVPGSGSILSESEFNTVKWYINNGTGNYTVPFGHGTNLSLPLTLSISSAGTPAGGSAWVNFSTWHSDADNYTGTASVTGAPSDVSNMASATSGGSPSNSDNSYNAADRFWVIEPNNYFPNPSISNIQFSYISSNGSPSEVSSPNIFSESDLIAQRFNPAAGMGWSDFGGIGGSDVVTGNIGNVQSGAVLPSQWFRSWTLSSSVNPLPVQLSYFGTNCLGSKAVLYWTVESEVNDKYFTIQKTSDGEHFYTVGTVMGAGNSGTTKHYSITDNNPMQGTSYYLLKETDADGNMAQIGKTITYQSCEDPETSVTAFNTQSYIDVQINAIYDESFNISLVNILGQQIIHETHPALHGFNEFKIPNTGLASGMYVIEVNNSRVNYSTKLMVGVR